MDFFFFFFGTPAVPYILPYSKPLSIFSSTANRIESIIWSHSLIVFNRAVISELKLIKVQVVMATGAGDRVFPTCWNKQSLHTSLDAIDQEIHLGGLNSPTEPQRKGGYYPRWALWCWWYEWTAEFNGVGFWSV